jgi:hypothetical protein
MRVRGLARIQPSRSAVCPRVHIFAEVSIEMQLMQRYPPNIQKPRPRVARSHPFMLLMPRPLPPRWRSGCSCPSVARSVRKRHAACRPTWFHPILPPRVMRLGFSRHISIVVLVNLVCTTLEAQAVLDSYRGDGPSIGGSAQPTYAA